VLEKSRIVTEKEKREVYGTAVTADADDALAISE